VSLLLKTLLFANTDWYLYNFRLPLAQALRQRGDEVVLVSPPGDYAAQLEQLGFRWVSFPLSRRGINPFAELTTLIRLARLYDQERPDLVHHFTVKCVLYGSLAARWMRIRRIVNSVTGLGYVFIGSEFKARSLRGLVKWLYRFALENTRIIFQNPDDRAIFLENGLVDAAQCTLIRGSGVDMTQFAPLLELGGKPLVVLPARMLWDKGVGEFVEAATLLRDAGVRARFALVGDSDPDNPASVPLWQLGAWQKEGVVEWWGWQEDMLAVYAQANIVCLPSYREGAPRSLIEAAACGRAIVATDVPGCREVVQDGVNGFLVPVRDAQALADGLRTLISDSTLRQQMAERSRQLVEKEFSVETVVNRTLAVYDAA